MKTLKHFLGLFWILLLCVSSVAQTQDSLQERQLLSEILAIEKQRILDSVKKAQLVARLDQLKEGDDSQKNELEQELAEIDLKESTALSLRKARIDSLRSTAQGYPVLGVDGDTLFLLYSKTGALTASERAKSISEKIKNLYSDDFFGNNTLEVVASEDSFDIVYAETIVMNVSENDALWYQTDREALANDFKNRIETSIVESKANNSLSKILLRIGLALLVIGIVWFLVWLVGKGYRRLLYYIHQSKEKWLKNLSYKDYTFLSADQELQVVLFLVKILRWVVLIVLVYIALPIIFSIFPVSRNWADKLFQLVWSPFKGVFVSIWEYLPNLFSILVIYFVMKYVIRFVRYIFKEIESEKLNISGFHSDWAKPTFSIVKFLLYAFMFVLIFPFLPGSDSDIFKGVSVFVGILFSLGSSTAIANMVAGLVITYMRPFKIGDRIKIGDVSGDVVEKTLLVTRVKTIKNEIITIPNSSVLSGNTTNYTSETAEKGLILHTTVTIGYDVPWKDMHQVLIDAALKTDMILKDPMPFVLQTSLDDFYVSYQINAYTREASKQALIYSQLNQNIQDTCNERGIEILSPHYRAARDGNRVTIPSSYLPKDYKAPSFQVHVDKKQ
ncbi:MAG: transmembrane ion channel [Flavobacteriaceae bacterium]|nr:transmembrane ion channel [Flavobacteriaceae bacterium]|tara:strand:- start:343 stop:2187 length:1845 start_codon:yes stop_codon:yes gene_type:complete